MMGAKPEVLTCRVGQKAIARTGSATSMWSNYSGRQLTERVSSLRVHHVCSMMALLGSQNDTQVCAQSHKANPAETRNL